jgi:hypothetical protein
MPAHQVQQAVQNQKGGFLFYSRGETRKTALDQLRAKGKVAEESGITSRYSTRIRWK